MKSKLTLCLTGLILLLLLLVGCGRSLQESSPESVTQDGYHKSSKKEEELEEIRTGQGDRLLIYTSIYPLYDFVHKIGGERVEVKMIVPPGAEPHDFEPTPAHLIELHQADLFIYNGLGLETWVNHVLEAIDNPGLLTVESSADIEKLTGASVSHADHQHSHDPVKPEETDQEEIDPHIWLDPLRAKQQAKAITQAMVQADPENSSYYKQNFDKLARSFDALHAQFKEMSEQAKRRDFVVSHQAFGYLADRYGLRQVAITGLSPSQEPGPKKMEEIIRFVRENEIKYILIEKNVAHHVAEVIHEETGAKVLALYNLETLNEKEMAKGHDYFSIMERNLNALKIALGEKEQ